MIPLAISVQAAAEPEESVETGIPGLNELNVNPLWHVGASLNADVRWNDRNGEVADDFLGCAGLTLRFNRVPPKEDGRFILFNKLKLEYEWNESGGDEEVVNANRLKFNTIAGWEFMAQVIPALEIAVTTQIRPEWDLSEDRRERIAEFGDPVILEEYLGLLSIWPKEIVQPEVMGMFWPEIPDVELYTEPTWMFFLGLGAKHTLTSDYPRWTDPVNDEDTATRTQIGVFFITKLDLDITDDISFISDADISYSFPKDDPGGLYIDWKNSLNISLVGDWLEFGLSYRLTYQELQLGEEGDIHHKLTTGLVITTPSAKTSY